MQNRAELHGLFTRELAELTLLGQMDNGVSVKSSRDTARLILSDVTKESFTALLEGGKFSGCTLVNMYMSGPPSTLFDEMARDWKGWTGTKTWAALEDELRMEATADSTGHVSLVVTMRDYTEPTNWRLKATLDLKAGQLQELARAVAKAFRD